MIFPYCFLCAFALGDVLNKALHKVIGADFQRRAGDQGDKRRSIFPQEFYLTKSCFTLICDLCKQRERGFFREQIDNTQLEEFFLGVSGHCAEGRINFDITAIEFGDPYPFTALLYHGTIPKLTFPKCFFCPLPFCDILYQTVIRNNDAILIAMENKGIPHPSHGSIFVDNAMFNRIWVFTGRNPPRLFFHPAPILRHYHIDPQVGIVGEFVRLVTRNGETSQAMRSFRSVPVFDTH